MTFEATRSKQLLVLQPKGKALYDDKSSFGFKMLEQWGWKGEGHGLGKNQQGDKDFIKVRYRNTATGLGFDRLKDNQWTENETNFNELLLSLNANNSDGNEIQQTKSQKKKSLEEASKSSRARVHYKKFTKGKDVFKYSEKDLANILGKKTLNESETKVESKEEEQQSEEEFTDPMQSSMIINTGISINDYFNKKKRGEMAEDQEIKDVSKKNKKKLEQAEPDIAEEPKKKSKWKQKEAELKEAQNDDQEVEVEKVKKTKRKQEEEPVETTKSKKKKKKVEEPVAEDNSTPDDKGSNAIYGKDTIKVNSYVAHKMSSMTIDNFTSANLGNIVGYGMTEDIEIKVVKTKFGDNSMNTDKYSIYNMDSMIRVKQNPRKILTKIKKTQKSIQML